MVVLTQLLLQTLDVVFKASRLAIIAMLSSASSWASSLHPPLASCALAVAQPTLLSAVRLLQRQPLYIINTAIALVYRPEVVSDHCRFFLAQMGVIRQPSPVDIW